MKKDGCGWRMAVASLGEAEGLGYAVGGRIAHHLSKEMPYGFNSISSSKVDKTPQSDSYVYINYKVTILLPQHLHSSCYMRLMFLPVYPSRSNMVLFS